MDAAALRAEFPLLDTAAYLNAGTCGPLPRAAVRAAGDLLGDAAREGRGLPFFERAGALRERLRSAYAERLGAAPADLALTTCTSEGLARVLLGLDLGPRDEILTAQDEHPGLLGPLAELRRRRGVRLRTAPLERLADAAGPGTTLVACSHVSWVTGAVAPVAGLAALGIPVVLDGAQGAGAIPVDVESLGCAAYAAAGQKWLCGPVGTGMLWLSPAFAGRVSPAGPTYPNLAVPDAGLDAEPWPDARRHDAWAPAVEALAGALAAHETLAAHGWPQVHARAAALAGRLAAALAERGRSVAPRGPTTLVAWRSAEPAAERERLRAAGVLVRDLPGTDLLRASVGAWNDEEDLERLLAALGPAR